MPRYMIELPFAATTFMESIPKFRQRELDFLPQVYWGATIDGESGWAIVEADSLEDAAKMVPESIADMVWICELKTLTPELIEAEQRGEIERAA